jgi:proline dehydrogenase
MSSLFDRLVVGALPFVPKTVVHKFARRYVAGESLEDAIRTVRELEAEGAMSTIDVLGESVTRREQTEKTRDEYLHVLDTIAATRLPANVSVKPTAVGLSIDPELVRENCRAICLKAAESGTPPSPRRRSSSSST